MYHRSQDQIWFLVQYLNQIMGKELHFMEANFIGTDSIQKIVKIKRQKTHFHLSLKIFNINYRINQCFR